MDDICIYRDPDPGGVSTEEIGDVLALSPATVRNYLSNSIGKIAQRPGSSCGFGRIGQDRQEDLVHEAIFLRILRGDVENPAAAPTSLA